MPASPLGGSVISDYLNCERLGYYRNVLKLSSKKTPVYFAKGDIYHKFCEHRYLGTPHLFDLNAQIRDHMAKGTIFDTIDVEHLEATTAHYIDHFASWKIIGVEKNFVLDLNGVPYTMRLDLLAIDSHGDLHLIDHKTSERNDIKKNLYHGSLTGYWIGCQKSGYDVKRITINQIVWAHKDKDGVVQYTQVPPQGTTKTIKECDMWLYQMENKVKEYLTKVDRAHEEKDVLDPKSFNKNLYNCYNFGVCKFNPLCKYEVNPDTLDMMYTVGERR